MGLSRRKWFIALVLALNASVALSADLPDQIKQLPDQVKPGVETLQSQETFMYPELEPEPGKYIVPPVVDRPLGSTEGPRIKINAIELRGAVDRPEKGLMVDDIWKIIEKKRSANPDGMTIGQLQEMANDITDFYRDKGFIVGTAFIPVQTVEDGIVTVQVLEGVLGRVMVEGQQRYKPEMLAQPFDPLVGQPLTKDQVEGTLISLTDYPGLTAFGVFQPGENIGESDLVIKVQEEDPGDLKFSVNNRGSRFTGEYVARLDLDINNMLKLGDKLSLGMQESFDPSLADAKSFDYSFMLFKPQYRMEMGAEVNNFEIADSGGIGGSSISGFSRIGYVRLRDDLQRGRVKNSHVAATIYRKGAQTFQGSSSLSKDSLSNLELEYAFDSLDLESRGVNQFTAQYTKGLGQFLGAMDGRNDKDSSRQGGGGLKAGSNFDKLLLSYTRLQSLGKNRSALFRSSLQYTDDLLVGMEQFSIGGSDSVRAYSNSEFIVDRGFFMSGEFIFSGPFLGDKVSWFGNRKWSEVFSVSGFVDWGYGEKVDPLPSEAKVVNVKGWGVGAQLTVPRSFTSKITAAVPFDDSPTPNNERKPQVWVNFEADLF